jgi:ATP-dependent helicase/DNAse subunit B
MSNELVEDYYKSMNDFFERKVRAVTEADRGVLPRLSYSGLEVFKNCPYQFNLKYGEKKYTKETTLALELGSLCHLILELKCNYIKTGKPVDYDYLHFILKYGSIDTNEKTKEHILGVDELKRKYFEEWYEPDNASGMTYEEKMKVFEKVLKEEMNHASIWHPIYAELPFEFVYKDRVIFNGFIDRVDINIFGGFRTVDYKTSKKQFESAKVVTSLQFGIYAMAIYQEFGQIPVSFLYRFILIDEDQMAMTSGWERRLEKTLDNTLDKMDKNKKSGIWLPKPSALCYWCNYSTTNPKAHEFKGDCEYYSLWTPQEKSWAVNKKYNALDNTIKKRDNKEVKKRKLNF